MIIQARPGDKIEIIIQEGQPEPPVQMAAVKPTAQLKASELAKVKRQTLLTVLAALDGWIDGAHDNHQASEHHHENRGEECWRQFAPSDFRHMINDAARELGLIEFDPPAMAIEDRWSE